MPLSIRVVAVGCLLSMAMLAQEVVSIAEASARSRPLLGPSHNGERLVIRGIVAGPVVWLRPYAYRVVQDDSGNGITLEASREELERLNPGDRVEVSGAIATRAGLPVLRPDRIQKTGRTLPPAPQKIEMADLTRFSNVGRYMTTEAFVITAGQNTGGDVLVIGNSGVSLTVFMWRESHSTDSGFLRFRAGDRVRVTGLSSQYCPIPPYDQDFQILVPNAAAVTLVSRGWLLSPGLLSYGVLGIMGAVALWWRRERRLARQRSVLQTVMALSEDVISASSPREIVRRLQNELSRAIGADGVEVFLFDPANHRLDRVASESARQPLSINVDEPIGSFYSAVALCFRNRALLHVPDTRRAPIVSERENELPSSAVFVPMIAQRELLGVLAAYYRKGGSRADHDRHAALQHLANQIAASLKLQEQQHMREQLLRSEKMAAAGQLISAVANDLRSPLDNIAKSARDLLERSSSGQPELHEIAIDSERGLEMVSHLVSFARMERSEARPIDLHALLNTLLEMREQDRTRKGVKAEVAVPVTPVEVLADQGQLEQALLTVLVHAEHAAAVASDRIIRVSSRVVGKRVQVAFDCSLNSPESAADLAKGDYFGLPVSQAIARSHGGDLRQVTGRSGYRLEFELPTHAPPTQVEKPAAPLPRPVRVLTALIVEPDTVAQRKLLATLSARGHRAIPAANAEDAADMAQRMAFDVVFCAVRLPGLSWVELFQRVRRRIGAFALLTEGYDPDSARAFKNGEGQVLPKPVQDRDLDNFLALVEVRQAAARR